MPGRVKYKSSTHQPIPSTQRRLHPRVDNPAQTTSVFDSTSGGAQEFQLNKSTIIWLVVISVILMTTLVVVTCLLCRCRCRKRKTRRHSNGRRHHPSLEITDGRNQFNAWNRNAPTRVETYDSGVSLEPLARAAVRPGGVVHPGEPVIVEEELVTPDSSIYKRKTPDGRYYSRLSSAWKRISQIGRAY